MEKNITTTRRNFIKAGFISTGAGLFRNKFDYFDENDPLTLSVPGPIPLNNILIDYRQRNPKYASGLQEHVITNREGWEDKRKSILERGLLMLGEQPHLADSTLHFDILMETPRKGYKELKVQFLSGSGDMIKGFLLVPDKAGNNSPLPAIMALHSTGPGAVQTIGLIPKENRTYGQELAQRGYVVLAIDVISAGERIYPGYDPYYTNEFYLQYPKWSAMGKMIHDHQRGLDILCSLDFVDPDKLGCIGHSLGGYNAFFLLAYEQRIKAAVSSCGLSPMGRSNMPYQFARNDWFVHFNPVCRNYIRSGMIPCDMHEFMALCAPRPLFNYSARMDEVYFPFGEESAEGYKEWWKTVDMGLAQVEKVYEILGATENFVRVEKDGGHDFPADVRETAYKWLDKQLGMTK